MSLYNNILKWLEVFVNALLEASNRNSNRSDTIITDWTVDLKPDACGCSRKVFVDGHNYAPDGDDAIDVFFLHVIPFCPYSRIAQLFVLELLEKISSIENEIIGTLEDDKVGVDVVVCDDGIGQDGTVRFEPLSVIF